MTAPTIHRPRAASLFLMTMLIALFVPACSDDDNPTAPPDPTSRVTFTMEEDGAYEIRIDSKTLAFTSDARARSRSIELEPGLHTYVVFDARKRCAAAPRQILIEEDSIELSIQPSSMEWGDCGKEGIRFSLEGTADTIELIVDGAAGPRLTPTAPHASIEVPAGSHEVIAVMADCQGIRAKPLEIVVPAYRMKDVVIDPSGLDFDLDRPASVSAGRGAHDDRIRVTWNDPNPVMAKSYVVERSRGSSDFRAHATTTATRYTDTDITPMDDYRYRVRAVWCDGRESAASDIAFGYARGARFTRIDVDIDANTKRLTFSADLEIRGYEGRRLGLIGLWNRKIPRFGLIPIPSDCGGDVPGGYLGSVFDPIRMDDDRFVARVSFWVNYDRCFADSQKSGSHYAQFTLYEDVPVSNVRDPSIAKSPTGRIEWPSNDKSSDHAGRVPSSNDTDMADPRSSWVDTSPGFENGSHVERR